MNPGKTFLGDSLFSSVKRGARKCTLCKKFENVLKACKGKIPRPEDARSSAYLSRATVAPFPPALQALTSRPAPPRPVPSRPAPSRPLHPAAGGKCACALWGPSRLPSLPFPSRPRPPPAPSFPVQPRNGPIASGPCFGGQPISPTIRWLTRSPGRWLPIKFYCFKAGRTGPILGPLARSPQFASATGNQL